MLLVLLGKIIFVCEHAVATIDIPPGEWLWRLLYESLTHLWLMSAWGVEPGFGQRVGRVVDPGWTRYLVTSTEPFDRGSTESRPIQGVDGRLFREGEWIGNKLRSSIYGVVKPLVHEIAQRNPRTFTLTDSLIGLRHRVFAITCAHSVSRFSLRSTHAHFFHSSICCACKRYHTRGPHAPFLHTMKSDAFNTGMRQSEAVPHENKLAHASFYSAERMDGIDDYYNEGAPMT